MTPQCVAVSPMLQLQFEPGSIPAASTSATRVATDDTVETGGATTGAAFAAGTGTETATTEVAVGADAAATGDARTTVAGVVVPRAAPEPAPGVVHTRCGDEDGTDEGRWRLSATPAATASVATKETTTKRRCRRVREEGGEGCSTMC
jgi:hypothetical protein